MDYDKLLSLAQEPPLNALLGVTTDDSFFALIDNFSNLSFPFSSEYPVLAILERALQCVEPGHRNAVQSLITRLMKSAYMHDHMVKELDSWQAEDLLYADTRSNVQLNVDRLLTILIHILQAEHTFLSQLNGLLKSLKSAWAKIQELELTAMLDASTIQKYSELLEMEDSLAKKSSEEPEKKRLALDSNCVKSPCQYRLKCGHACHRIHEKHQEEECTRTCTRKCPRGHRCGNVCHSCQPKCAPCGVLIDTQMPCGHENVLLCSAIAEEAPCTVKVFKERFCGHVVEAYCSEEPGNVDCKELIEKIMVGCEHRLQVECSASVWDITCPNPCGLSLDCDHQCTGTCGECRQGRLHKRCQATCKQILVCGHACKFTCCSVCPPCSQPCENKCIHSQCRFDPAGSDEGGHSCGEPCPPCQEPCGWTCEHQQCSEPCNELCRRLRCNRACDKNLICGHPCIGLCGERCPKVCRICDPENEVFEVCFGREDEADAQFVVLEDCSHVLEVDALDRWMDSAESTEPAAVQLKSCPKCNTAIRTSYRYGNIVKRQLQNIERVKEKMRIGNADFRRLMKRQDELALKVKNVSSNIDAEWLSEGAGLANYLLGLLREPAELLTQQRLLRLENAVEFMSAILKIFAQIDPRKDPWFTAGFKTFQENNGVTNAIESWMHKLPSCSLPKFVEEPLAYLHAHLELEANLLFAWLTKNTIEMSDQMAAAFNCEITRVTLACDLGSFLATQTTRDQDIKAEEVMEIADILYGTQQISDELAGQIWERFSALRNRYPNPTAVSDRERVAIRKALKLGRGHWYACQNGHIYAIGECGQPNQVGRCPECKTTIGGTNHRLKATNRKAPEMTKAGSSSDAA